MTRYCADLYLNGNWVDGISNDTTNVNTTNGTMLFGDPSGKAGDGYFDDVMVYPTFDSVNRLGDSSFETGSIASGLNGFTPDGRWRAYNAGPDVSSPVHSGSKAAHVTWGQGWYHQDVVWDPTWEDYWVDFWVYMVSGTHQIEWIFNWDRGGGYAQGGGAITWYGSGVWDWSAWNASGHPAYSMAYNSWQHLQIHFYPCNDVAIPPLQIRGRKDALVPGGSPMLDRFKNSFQESNVVKGGHW